MSKENSHLFPRTSGEGQALIAEVIANGKKISPDKVLLITQNIQGEIVWLETGDSSSGFQHIVERHGHEFASAGISNVNIPNYVLEAVYQANVIGFQGKRNPRTVYEFVYNGEKRRIAIQVGSNGYIVSANPRSMEEI